MRSENLVPLLAILIALAVAVGNSGCGGSAPPPPISVTVSPATPQTVVENTSVTFTATVLNDPTNKGVTWQLEGILPGAKSACSTSTKCGTLSNQTALSVTYTAPSSNPFANNIGENDIAVSAESVADSTKFVSVALNIVPPPLTVSTSSLPNGTVNASYSVTLQSSGGTPPITWGTGAGLPSGLSLSRGGTISGTPTIPGSGCSNVSATDSSTPPQVVTQSLCIGINSSDVSHNALLKGHYALLINRLGLSQTQDFIQIAMAGSFVADGAGNITGGVSDTNGAGVGVQANQSFTGTYALGADNRGTLSISSPTEAVGYAFSVGSISASGVATKGHMIQFTPGAVTLAGELELQDPSTFSNSAVSGSYAFEWSGGTAGVFTADGKGGINVGTADEGVTANQPLTGTYNIAANSADGRGTGTLTIAGTNFDFAFYVVSAGKMFMVSADPASSPVAFTGLALKQSGGPFNSSSLSGTSVFRTGGTGGSGQVLVDFVEAGLQTFDGRGTVTGILDENNEGIVILDSSTPSYSYSVSSNGRVAVVTTAGTVVYVLYLVSPGTGFIEAAGSTGFLEPQSAGPFAEGSIDGNFSLGDLTIPLNLSTTVSSGVATLKMGTMNLTGDINEDGTLSYGQSSQDTYAVAANGRVTTGSGKQVIYIISPTKFLMINVDPTNTTPDIAVAEQ
jgi:hypothetical protein